MKKILYITALAVALTACTTDPTDNGGVDVPTTAMECISANINNDIESRNSLLDEDGKRFILWSEGDAIGINSTEGAVNNAQGILDAESAGTTVGKFWYAKDLVGGDIKYAYYPYNNEAIINDTYFVTKLASEQQYVEGSVFASNVTIMVGKNDENGLLQFVNSCAMVEFKLKGTQKLSSLKLKSASTPLAGAVRVDVSATTPVATIDATAGDVFNTITLQLGYGIQLSASEPTSFYFVIPAGSYKDLSLTAVDNEGNEYVRDLTQSRTIEVRHLAPFSPFTVGEVLTEGAVDLSAEGVSNCYMVDASKGGRYYFESKNIGNNINAEAIANVDILWSDAEGILGNTHFDKATNRYYFTTHGSNDNGSAIVSAFDADGNVLWSWHIWVTNAEEYTLTSAKNIVMLDRNVGARYTPKSAEEVKAMSATDAAATCGFYYQLGRSNPFPGPKTLDSWYDNHNFNVLNQYGYETNLFSSNTYAFVNEKYKETHKFKNEFFDSMTHTIASCASTPMSLWHGNTMDYLQTWAADLTDLPLGGSDKTWSATKKGEQDPCPQGYRAATFEEYLSAVVYYEGTTSVPYSHYNLNSKSVVTASTRPLTSNLDNYGGYHAGDKTNGHFVWLPHCGLRISYLKTAFVITEKTPAEYTETGKLYYTGFLNYPSNGTDVLKSGTLYLRGVTTQEYEKSANIHYPGSWTRHCSEDVCTPVVVMSASDNAKADLDNSNKYRNVPFASAVPVRCVKLQ